MKQHEHCPSCGKVRNVVRGCVFCKQEGCEHCIIYTSADLSLHANCLYLEVGDARAIGKKTWA